MKPGSIFVHRWGPPLNQLRTKDPWREENYIFIKHVDNSTALIYSVYMGEIEYAETQSFKKYFIRLKEAT